MNRRSFLTGVAASAVLPAFPSVPVRPITATAVLLKQQEFMAIIEATLYPIQKQMLEHLIIWGQVHVDYSNWPPRVIEPSSLWRQNMELNITLAGANFRPADAKAFIKESLSRDTKIILEREPSNAWDSNAIKIVCKDDMDEDVFIGYVPKSDNAVLAQSLDADKPYSIIHTGFLGTIQPTFKIEFELLSIEERNAALDNVEDTDEYENGRTPSNLDDEIPF